MFDFDFGGNTKVKTLLQPLLTLTQNIYIVHEAAGGAPED